MTILEARACGLPTITTAWGGNMDYCSVDTNLLVSYELVPAEGTNYFTWAEPNIDHIKELMLWAYRNRSKAGEIGARAAEHAHSNWTWAVSAQSFADLIQRRLNIVLARR